MLDTEKDRGAISSIPPDGPARTTFADGRLTTKEAWNYCRSLCNAAEIQAPTLRTFKWHLRHGNEIQGERVRNPFNSSSNEKVLAIEVAAVQQFVKKFVEKGDELRAVEQSEPSSGAVKRKPKVPEKTTPKKETKSEKVVEYDIKDAFKYLRSKVGHGCELNLTTFRFYITYDVLSSRLQGRQRLIRRDDLDAFLELVPDAVYANHLTYETEKQPDDMSMREAYAYYSEVEPTPITLNSFRSLVAAGIIRPIRTSNDPKAPVLGFRRQEIVAFLALRQRILEQNSDTTATESFLTKKPKEQLVGPKTKVEQIIEDALERARPVLEKAQRKAETSQEKPKKPSRKKASSKVSVSKKEDRGPNVPSRRDLTVAPLAPAARDSVDPERVSVKEAYAYYYRKCERPFTISWFRSKIANGLIFDAVKVPDSGPKGHKYLVSLESIDAYLKTSPKGRTTPEYVAVETAYHRLTDIIPTHMSLLQFKRLVDSGAIKTSNRKGAVRVAVDAVREYFRGDEGTKAMPEELSISEAHAYYCSQVFDPVARPRFAKWVRDGIIGQAQKKDGIWKVPFSSVSVFIDEHPTGRFRANRNSKVSRKQKTPDLDEGLAASEEADEEEEMRVAVSIRDYSGPDELKEAIEMLTQQGFHVDVRP